MLIVFRHRFKHRLRFCGHRRGDAARLVSIRSKVHLWGTTASARDATIQFEKQNEKKNPRKNNNSETTTNRRGNDRHQTQMGRGGREPMRMLHSWISM